MNNKKSIYSIGALLLCIVVAVVIFFVFIKRTDTKVNKITNEKLYPEITAEAQKTKVDSIVSSEKLFVMKGSESAGKTYKITVKDGVFSPTQTVVEKGKQSQIVFVGEDVDYDVAFKDLVGVHLMVPKWQIAGLLFNALPNIENYIFECKDLCPEGKKISGEIVAR